MKLYFNIGYVLEDAVHKIMCDYEEKGETTYTLIWETIFDTYASDPNYIDYAPWDRKPVDYPKLI